MQSHCKPPHLVLLVGSMLSLLSFSCNRDESALPTVFMFDTDSCAIISLTLTDGPQLIFRGEYYRHEKGVVVDGCEVAIESKLFRARWSACALSGIDNLRVTESMSSCGSRDTRIGYTFDQAVVGGQGSTPQASLSMAGLHCQFTCFPR